MDYRNAKPYKILDFCKHVNCQSIRKPKEKPCLEEFCPAYQFHTYLRDHRQIIEEGSDLANVAAEVGRLQEELSAIEKALELAIGSIEDSCPNEYDYVNKLECENCPHLQEVHVDTERDVRCWKEYYLQQAKAGDSHG